MSRSIDTQPFGVDLWMRVVGPDQFGIYLRPLPTPRPTERDCEMRADPKVAQLGRAVRDERQNRLAGDRVVEHAGIDQ